MKILIVDNDDVSLYKMQILLASQGYEVIVTSDGKEALERLTDGDISLIISDILLPVMDGFALCCKVREDPDFQYIPFIVHTATFTRAQDEELALSLGASRFIIKPCEPDVLLRIVNDMIDESSRQGFIINPSIKTAEETLKLFNECLIKKLERRLQQAESDAKAKQVALEALTRSESLLNASQIISKIGSWGWNIVRSETYWSQETYRIFDFDIGDIALEGTDSFQKVIQCFDEEDRPRISEAFRNCLENGIPYELDCKITTAKGRKLFIRTSGTAVYEGDKIVKAFGVIQDVTESAKKALEMMEIKEQLWQAQKLDSIGQLAGGIAHDFNNILTVILGYSKEILSALQPDSPLYSDIGEIVKAGQKAINLTRQLLTFSRKHIIQPQVTQLNTIIGELSNMLVRLIGEDIEYNTILAENLGYIKADIFQIEQAIMNLVINAREAMPSGGKLWIETSNLVLDQASMENFTGIPPGNYIMLTISDNGCGMSKETSNRIFEPFYTTKQMHRGTGLGLSLVYGIVTQADGLIKVYSEPGHGTTFKIFLPQTTEPPATIQEKPVVTELLGNGEQIIVVDDDAPVGILIKKMIEKLNYQVALFEHPEAAIGQIIEQASKPDLLVTDVIMPGMNGKELADRLSISLPDLKVLFMSGYADSVIFQSGVLQREFPFIQKPFTKEGIGLQIRQLLRKEQKPALDGTYILMIDDDEDLMRIYKRSFTKQGYQLICRESLMSALEALANLDFQVILVDNNIPGTDGESVIRAIREAGYNTPVIALSGDIHSIDLETLKPLGVVSAFEKSTDIQPLIEEIEKLINL